MKKKRGHGWARRKGFNKKHSRACKDNIVRLSVSSGNTKTSDQHEKKKTNKPSLTARKTTFTEDWKALVRHRFPERFVHSDACHFFDENAECPACWENWKMDLYARYLIRGSYA